MISEQDQTKRSISSESPIFAKIILMKHVQVSSIEKAIAKVDNLDDDGLEKLSETYALAQQTLLAYVMTAAVEYDNEELEGLLIYYYCLLSEAFAQESFLLNQITEDDIDAFEEPFFEALDAFFENDDEEILSDFTDQPDLVRFMMMEVSTPDEDGTELNDETATQLFIVTMAMISLLGRALN
ncbi:MAG: hypothetical protein A3D92_12260 [Bacteroidetes bacterium RIFCSPHIGHO2_02_FULL_44_7]|nr:MAG: hypothetical protein A3D92_12260 [Bacteroidetes bacterium RIFCSPHIGHO2_02_FULL_44_7]